MSPIDTVLDRLSSYRLRENTPGRWRAVCPVCGEKNASTLSIGEGDSGAVLLKCFKHGCSADAIARALGLEIEDLFPPKPSPGGGTKPMRRRRLITAGQALDLLSDEITFALVCAADLSRGEPIDEATRERLIQAAARVTMLRDEVHA